MKKTKKDKRKKSVFLQDITSSKPALIQRGFAVPDKAKK